MVQYHPLIFFLATVTLEIYEARGGRSYNVNSNVNQNILDGSNGRPSREDEIRDREELYVDSHGDVLGPVYDTGFDSPESEYSPSQNFATEHSEPEYVIDMIENEGSYGGAICDDGSYRPFFRPFVRNRLVNPSSIERESRGEPGLQAYRRTWKGPPPFIDPSMFRRSSNWGHLSPPDVPWRQLQRRPVMRPIPKGKDPILDTYEKNVASNMNANANSNAMYRRSNAHANTNTNIISRYGLPRHTLSAGRQSPSQASYVPPKYAPVVPASLRQPPAIRKPRPGYSGQWQRPSAENQYDATYIPSGNAVDDDYDNDGGYMEYGGGGANGNANVNSNSNVNIISRRMKPRDRRSIERQSQQNFVIHKLDKDATTKVVIEESSTSDRP